MVPAVVLFVLLGVATAVSTFLELPTNQTVVEGGDATLSCNATVNGARQPLTYRIGNGAGSTLQSVGGNITNLSMVDGVVGACVFGEYQTQLILKGVTRQADGYNVTCTVLDGIFFVEPENEPPAFLSVIYPPAYSLLPNQPTTVLEGEGFTYSFVLESKPSPASFTWSRNGQVISSDGRIATSVSTISITSTTRSDSGVYEVVSYNEAGRGAGNVTLDVQYPPEYANTASVQQTELMVTASFTLNCTPSAASPPVDNVSIEVNSSSVTTSFDTVTVTDNVLTIPSVQRSHSGNYSCNATNTRGSAVIYHNLLVIAPPGRLENLGFSSIGPYSVTITWDPPTDDGGTPAPLNYMVALTTTSDGRSVSANQTAQAQLTFTALSHSENYTVSVVAVNSLGQQGPSAVGTVRTRDIPPVIGTVTAEALSLSEVQVTVTLSDNGGQPVEKYNVTINGTVMTFSGSADLQFIGTVTGLSLVHGVTYPVSVVARNSVGASETFRGMVTATFVVQDLSGTVDTGVIIGVVVALVIVILILILAVFVIVLVCMKCRDAKAMRKPENEGSGDADYNEMVDTRSTDPLAPQYVDPSTLEQQAPPPVVTYKKEEEAAAVQPAPAASGVVYADLDFSKQQAFGSKKSEKKKTGPIEAVVYSEVRLMTPQEKQQKQVKGEGEVGADGEEPHSPTTIM